MNSTLNEVATSTQFSHFWESTETGARDTGARGMILIMKPLFFTQKENKDNNKKNIYIAPKSK